MATRLLILGTSRFATEVLDLAEDTGQFDVVGFVENLDRERTRTTLAGLPVLWFDDVLDLAATHLAIGSLGTTRRRSWLEQAEGAGFSFATVVHPTAHISRRSHLGAGTVVSAGVVVGAQTTVGRHVILNRGALLGHDARIGDFVTIGPGVNVAGATVIGTGSYLGIAAVVLDGIQIGNGALIGAGSVVTANVAERTEVRGVPARVVREGIDGR